MDITVSHASTYAERAGIPKLILDFTAKTNSDVTLAILNVTAEIRVARAMIVHDIVSSYFVGYGVLESDGGQLRQHSEYTWRIAIPLSPYQLQKIEEVRDGKDLFLHVQFFCRAALRQDSPSPNVTDVVSPRVYEGGYSSGYCPFKIAQSDWVKILKDLGYGDCFLIEVPLRGVPTRLAMKKALVHLGNAWAHFNEARDEETLWSCYKAFEFLAKQTKVEDPNKDAFGMLLAGIEDEKKRRQLALLIDYVCRFLALGRHEEGEERILLDRRDSEYALILTQASLAYLARRLSEQSKTPSRSLSNPVKNAG